MFKKFLFCWKSFLLQAELCWKQLSSFCCVHTHMHTYVHRADSFLLNLSHPPPPLPTGMQYGYVANSGASSASATTSGPAAAPSSSSSDEDDDEEEDEEAGLLELLPPCYPSLAINSPSVRPNCLRFVVKTSIHFCPHLLLPAFMCCCCYWKPCRSFVFAPGSAVWNPSGDEHLVCSSLWGCAHGWFDPETRLR